MASRLVSLVERWCDLAGSRPIGGPTRRSSLARFPDAGEALPAGRLAPRPSRPGSVVTATPCPRPQGLARRSRTGSSRAAPLDPSPLGDRPDGAVREGARAAGPAGKLVRAGQSERRDGLPRPRLLAGRPSSPRATKGERARPRLIAHDFDAWFLALLGSGGREYWFDPGFVDLGDPWEAHRANVPAPVARGSAPAVRAGVLPMVLDGVDDRAIAARFGLCRFDVEAIIRHLQHGAPRPRRRSRPIGPADPMLPTATDRRWDGPWSILNDPPEGAALAVDDRRPRPRAGLSRPPRPGAARPLATRWPRPLLAHLGAAPAPMPRRRDGPDEPRTLPLQQPRPRGVGPPDRRQPRGPPTSPSSSSARASISARS